VRVHRFLIATALAVTTVVPATAHHSVGNAFDNTKRITLTGKISKLEWVNPHIYVYVDVVDASGKTARWEFETLPPNWMRRMGITRQDILGGPDVGQTVSVISYKPRDPAKTIGFLLRLTYADGHYIHLFEDPAAFGTASK
jgi:hypothetical protein